jgi:MerR family transcriptional regulator, heat shock protein HspR
MASRRTRIEFSADRGVFMISVAAELAEMHPQTLRMYEARGLIEPQRSPKGTRLYSQKDVERLRRIQEMTNELGLNLAGVEKVLELEGKLERAQARVEALERRAEQLKAEIGRLQERRDALRAEIVPYQEAKGELMRRQDMDAVRLHVTREEGRGSKRPPGNGAQADA